MSEELKPERDIRAEFVAELVRMATTRRDLTLYGSHPDYRKSEPSRNDQVEAIYMRGVQDAIGALISMTDSRELNGANFRLTTKDGEVVTFGSPKDKTYLETPGLIVLFNNKLNNVFDEVNN